MGSQTPKVLLPVAGRPILEYVITATRKSGAGRIILVVGAGGEEVKARFGNDVEELVVQPEQKGTADAVLCCRALLNPDDECAVVYGDVPLITGSTIRTMVDARRKEAADVAVLTAVVDNPRGYGRVVRGSGGLIESIVEELDANEEIRRIREVNSGFCTFLWGRLLPALELVKPSPVSGELYLTEAVRQVRARGGRVVAVTMTDPIEMSGVNTPEQLAEVSARMIQRASR
ncbi:MAG: NTP transferase domain-containing protein [candidate division WOR-3 bacterium]